MYTMLTLTERVLLQNWLKYSYQLQKYKLKPVFTTTVL